MRKKKFQILIELTILLTLIFWVSVGDAQNQMGNGINHVKEVVHASSNKEVNKSDNTALYRTESDTPVEAGDGHVPDNLADLANEDDKELSISSYQDWLNLAKLSKLDPNGLAGYTFDINLNYSISGTQSSTYDLTQTFAADLGTETFQGIGDSDHPFRGKLVSTYESTIRIIVGTPASVNEAGCPLFLCLSTEATVENSMGGLINIVADCATSGLSQELVTSEEHPAITLKNIQIDGVKTLLVAGTDDTYIYDTTTSPNKYRYISNPSGCAGGLFGELNNATTKMAEITGVNVQVNSFVSGKTSGGIIGKVNGDVKINLDDGLVCPDLVFALKDRSVKDVITGGIIGKVDGSSSHQVKVEISKGTRESIEINRAEEDQKTTYGDSACVIGNASYAQIHIDAPFTYTGLKGKDLFDVEGVKIGILFGNVSHSSIVCDGKVTIQNVRISEINHTDSTSACGTLAGSLIESSLDCSAGGVEIKNVEFLDNMNTINDSIGGAIGLVKNSEIKFDATHPCLINNMNLVSQKSCPGGAIGTYEISDGKTYSLGYLDVNDITINGVDKSGNASTAGGIISTVTLGTGSLNLSNSDIKGVHFVVDNVAGLVAGKVTSSGATGGKFTIDDVTAFTKSDDSSFDSSITIVQSNESVFGGMIGVLDSDCVIKGDLDDNKYSTCVVSKGSGDTVPNQYYGGVIGRVDNSSGATRKIAMKNIMAGSILKVSGRNITAAGGLVGYMTKKTALKLDGKINENGGISKDFKDIETTVACQNCAMDKLDSYYGSIVGMQNNALVYLQPTGEFIPSDVTMGYVTDEIGNYGGMIRNRNWDVEPTEAVGDESTWLIQNYEVTGNLGTEIANYGDLLRFAIAMNTEGEFLPTGNTGTTIDDISSRAYSLTRSEFDLVTYNTGLNCLTRNDAEGVSKCEFTGSFVGLSSKTRIAYDTTSYNQSYVGLFTQVKNATFKNLTIDGAITYGLSKYNSSATSSSMSTSNTNKKENAGGLCVYATGDVTMENVTSNCKIRDTKNGRLYVKYAAGERYYTDSEYFGGVIGQYTAADGKTCSMKNISVNQDFSLLDYNHVMGGVIGSIKMASDVTTANYEFSNIDIGGTVSIEAGHYYPSDTKASLTRCQTGGFIARIDSKLAEDKVNQQAVMTVDGISVNGMTVQSASYVYRGELGGFLGYDWRNTDVTMNDVKIGTDTKNVMKVCGVFGALVTNETGKLTVNTMKFGGTTAISELNSLSSSNQLAGAGDATKINCSLGVRNGQKLYMDVRDYSVGKLSLSNYGGTYFDELVGFNRGGDDANHGGIVSIGSADGNTYFLGRQGSGYQSYKDQYVTGKASSYTPKVNPNTRYYYDLNKVNYEYNSSSQTIDTANGMMSWHVLHYANESLRKWIVPSYSKLASKYIFKGNIDLSGYSYYPTPSSGETFTGQSAKIKLNASDITSGETAKAVNVPSVQRKYPDDSMTQHYMMHAGIFSNVSGIAAKDITVTGSYSATSTEGTADDSKAGALIAGTIYGIETGKDTNEKPIYDSTIQNVFDNIVLDDLWVDQTKGTISFENEIGLMIADISSGSTVSFDGIKMTGYTDDAVNNAYAASALIGKVGDEEATYIALSFKNMGITDADVGKGTDAVLSSAADEALAKASFIYTYNYAENCSGIYTFTYDDYMYGTGIVPSSPKTKAVTLGKELKNGEVAGEAVVEYYDKDIPVGRCEKGESGFGFEIANYLPYVYSRETTGKDITINPKAGHIDEGCGTYEDPYVIKTSRQLLTIYRYLYEEDKYKDTLMQNDWHMNQMGDDKSFCDGTHTTATYGEDTDKFPTKEQLSMAYYELKADVDLSAYPEFSGFGTKELPFNGVIVGEYKPEGSGYANGTYPTVIMPQETSAVTMLGFIQYAKGTVVQHLNIEYTSTVTINAATGGCAGGVISTIVGGDNILDGVTVFGKNPDSGEIIPCYTPSLSTTQIGGYVGCVELGGLILRNMKPENLQNFKTDSSEGNLYVSGIVGWVKDGFVVYEGSGNTSEQTMKMLNGSIYTNALNPSRSYDIINGDYLKQNATGDNAIKWDGSNYVIRNAAQLQVLSMALNSGALNYEGQSEASAGYMIGYNSESRQRTGDYSAVGLVVQSPSSAEETKALQCYNEVTLNDNLNGRETEDEVKTRNNGFYTPYVFDYMDLDSAAIGGADGLASVYSDSATKLLMNPSDVTGTNMQTVTLSQQNYDMSKFQKAFRGLGARYNRNNNSFRSNLVSSYEGGSIINVDMVVDGIQNITDAALLNKVTMPAGAPAVHIEGITLSGQIINSSVVQQNDGSIEPMTSESVDRNAAGFITVIDGACEFKNDNLENISIQSEYYAAGFVGIDTENSSVVFDGCQIVGSSEESKYSNKIQGVLDVGGFMASIQSNLGTSLMQKSGSVKNRIENTEILSTGEYQVSHPSTSPIMTISQNRYTMLGSNPVAGGVVGRADAKASGVDKPGIAYSVKDVDIVNTSIKAAFCSGGLIGRTNFKLDVKNIATDGLKIDAYTYLARAGGIIGWLDATKSGVTNIDSVSMKNLDVGLSFNATSMAESNSINAHSAAGIVGFACGPITMTNTTVGTKELTDFVRIHVDNQNLSSTTENKKKMNNFSFMASCGLIGRTYDSNASINMSDCSVLGVMNPEESQYTTQIIGTGCNSGVVSNSFTFNGDNITLDGLNITGGLSVGGYSAYGQDDRVFSLKNSKCHNVNLRLLAERSGGCGGVGGIVARGAQTSITDCSIDHVNIYGDYSYYSGGIIGRVLSSNNSYIKVLDGGKGTSVTNCNIFGASAGGVIGAIDNKKTSSVNNVTVDNNKIISEFEWGSSGLNNREYTAGGLVGRVSNSVANLFYGEDIQIKNNFISGYRGNTTSYVSAGGVTGVTGEKVYLYNLPLTDNYVGQMNKSTLGSTRTDRENFLMSSDASVLKDYLYTVKDLNSLVKLSDSSLSNLSTDDYYHYGYYTGAVTGGVYNRANSYMASYVGVSVDDSGIGEMYRPLSDAGIETVVTSTDKMYESYRENNNIVYDSYEAISPTNEFAHNIAAPLGSATYSFANLEKIWTNYKSGTNKASAYRMNTNYLGSATSAVSPESVYNETYYNSTDGYASVYETKDGDTIPMIVYHSSESGTLDEIIQTYINILTNNSGALNSTIDIIDQMKSTSDYVANVSIHKMKITDGVVSEVNDTKDANGNSSTASVKVSSTSTVSVHSTTAMRYEFKNNKYDSTTDSKNGTFSMLHIEYRGNGTAKRVLDIPIYVEQMLEVTSHTKFMSGLNYKPQEVKEKGKSFSPDSESLTGFTTGSSYSVYTEYVYGDMRTEYETAKIPKVLYMEDNGSGNKLVLTEGMKLTLIDINNRNKPYYYKVGSSVTEVSFSSFKDKNGSPYVLRDISKTSTGCPTQASYTNACGETVTDVGVEQYLILVDMSTAKLSDQSKRAYNIRITPEKVYDSESSEYNYALSKQLDYTEHCIPKVNEIPGIKYDIDETVSSLESGSLLGASGKIGVNLTYTLKADDTFWGMHKTDPAEQYVDLAIYLTCKGDSGNEVKVPLPSGTAFTINGKKKVAYGTNTIYYYKDSDTTYSLLGMSKNQQVEADISLDFSSADMSSLESGTYKVVADLIMTEDPNHPSGGEVKDTWSSSVTSEKKKDLGFAVEVNDLLPLGMNGYNSETTDNGVVNYSASILFPEEYIGTTNSSIKLREDAATKKYTIWYKILKKTSDYGDSPTYEELPESERSDIKLYPGVYTSKEDAEANAITSGKSIGYVTSTYSASDIKSGIHVAADGLSGLTNTSGLLVNHFTLVANRDQLDMKNYKVVAYLTVSDSEPEGGTEATADNISSFGLEDATFPTFSEETKNDFFVFTVAKIKTDLE